MSEASGASGRPALLLVEDEAMLLDIMRDVLSENGLEVISATTGDEAISLLEQRPDIALLFTDIRLPGSADGWAVAERARALHPGLPVIYATGFGGDKPRRVPDSILFTKPYRPSAIVRAIRDLGLTAG
jgi:CheY-like chemotaxis protein